VAHQREPEAVKLLTHSAYCPLNLFTRNAAAATSPNPPAAIIGTGGLVEGGVASTVLMGCCPAEGGLSLNPFKGAL